MMSRIGIALLLAVLPGAALAQSPATDWTGFYIGAQGGWQWHEDDFEDPNSPGTGREGTVDFDGGIAGGHIGADRQIGRLVLGVVGDIEWADGSGVEPAADVFGRAEANWQGSIRGRIGAAFGRVMVYGTGGAAFANYDFDYAFTGAPLFGAFGDEFNDTVTGWTAGGGAAVKFAAWEFWADYRFSDYGKTSGDITNCCAPPPFAQDHDVTTQAVRVGVSRRFGAPVPPP